MTQRDARRSDAYLAEEVAFDGTTLAERPGGDELRSLVELVVASAWWQDNARGAPVVRRVRVRTAADSHWAPATGTIALDPSEQWYVATHELAHVAAGAVEAVTEVHGPQWRGWNVALVAAVFGAEFAALLAASFERFALPAAALGVPLPDEPLRPVVPATPIRGGWRGGRA